MNFEKVLFLILEELEKNKIKYAVVGGLALTILGLPRATFDIDLLIEKKSAKLIDNILKKFEYKPVYKTENVAQYLSELKPFVEIYIIYAFRKISTEMLKRAKIIKIFNKKIRVLIPEDIIGLKIQTIANNPKRFDREMFDIRKLIEHYKENLNWNLIEKYFSIFSFQKDFKKLKLEYGNNK
jgi:hypothetical protein